jgi:hypothetical protein
VLRPLDYREEMVSELGLIGRGLRITNYLISSKVSSFYSNKRSIKNIKITFKGF